MDADRSPSSSSFPADDESESDQSGLSFGLFSGALLLLLIAAAVGWLAFHSPSQKPAAAARNAPARIALPVSRAEDDSLTCFLVPTQAQADQLDAEMRSFYLPNSASDHWYIMVVPTAASRARAIEDVAYLDEIRFARDLSSIDLVDIRN